MPQIRIGLRGYFEKKRKTALILPNCGLVAAQRTSYVGEALKLTKEAAERVRAKNKFLTLSKIGAK